MADPSLHGNGYPCPACEMRREAQDKGAILRPETPCNACGGLGRLAYSDAEIVARTVEEARRLYWPAFEARIARNQENFT